MANATNKKAEAAFIELGHEIAKGWIAAGGADLSYEFTAQSDVDAFDELRMKYVINELHAWELVQEGYFTEIGAL